MDRFEMFLNEAKRQRNKISKDLSFLYLFLLVSSIFILFYLDDNRKYLLFIVIVPVCLVTYTVDVKYKQLIAYCMKNKKNKELLLTRLEIKDFVLKYFKFSYYTSIIKYLDEAYHSLQFVDFFQDRVKIGPWLMEIDKKKTYELLINKKDQLYNKKSDIYLNLINQVDKMPEELKVIFKELGIKIEEPSDIMVDKIKNKYKYNLMYNVYGLVMNDSTLLSGGKKQDIFQLNQILIDFYDFSYHKLHKNLPIFELYVNLELPIIIK